MALFLSESDVSRILTMPMAIAAVEDAMVQLARGEALNIPRERLRGASTSMHLMQADVPGENAIGYKVYTVNGGVARFLVHLYDAGDGRLLAIMEAAGLGAMRTGAASGLATRLLARPDAAVLGVIGSGRQAAAQVEAVCAVRPVRQIKVFSRQRERLLPFCETLASRIGTPVHAALSAEEAVRGSDIVCTVTPSATPVLQGAWVGAGTHINATGSNMLSRREIGEDTLEKCSLIVVDNRETASREAGDLLSLVERGRLHWSRLTDLGQLAAGLAPGRQTPDDITCFESLGLAVQDITLAARLLAKARQQGLGIELPMS